MPTLFKGHSHASKCFLIKVQPSILKVGAIKRKDWPNYVYLLITLSWNHGEALNLCRYTQLSDWFSHTHLVHIPTSGSLFHLWLLITKTRLWYEVNQPWPSHVRVQLTLTRQNQCPLDPFHFNLTLLLFLPCCPSSHHLHLPFSSLLMNYESL